MGTSVPEPASEGGPAEHSLAAGPLILGLIIVALVVIGTALAWPAGSMVATQPGAHSTGDLQWVRLFVIVQSLAFGLFLAAVLLIRRWSGRAGPVLIIAAIIQLVPLAAPLMLSNDTYSYWNAGRLAAQEGANPYVDVPADYPDDPSFPYIPSAWRDRPTVYGPAFTLLSEAAVVAGDQAQVAAWLFRAMAGASMVALTFLVSRMAPRAAFAAVFVGWNPVFAFQFAGGGHNDVLMITLIVLGLWWVHRGRVRLAAAAWALSLFVKSLVVILIPLQVLEDRARGRPSLVPGIAVWILVLAALSTLAFGQAWPGFILPVVASAASTDLNSLAIWPRLALGMPDVVVKLGPFLGFAIAYLFLLRAAAAGRARHGLAIGLFLIASPFLWTWYVITPAALAAVDDDPPALLVALGLCAYTSLWLGASGNAIQVVLG